MSWDSGESLECLPPSLPDYKEDARIHHPNSILLMSSCTGIHLFSRSEKKSTSHDHIILSLLIILVTLIALKQFNNMQSLYAETRGSFRALLLLQACLSE